MVFPEDTGYQVTARMLMHHMLYDNGAVNRDEPDGPDRYPPELFVRITSACAVFFGAHPELLTDENLIDIACGERDSFGEFIQHPEYAELDAALNDYFDEM